MQRPAEITDPSDDAKRLRDEHVEFERVFEDIRNRASSGDWGELDAVWTAFSSAVEAHLVFEEADVFPALAQSGLDAQALVRQLQSDHAAIRRLLTELGVQIQLHVIRATTVEIFLDLMRDHAALENERVYPWIEARARAAILATPRGRGSR